MQRPPTRRRHSSPIQPPRPRPTPRRSSAGLPILDFPANQEDATPARQRHSSPYYTSPCQTSNTILHSRAGAAPPPASSPAERSATAPNCRRRPGQIWPGTGGRSTTNPQRELLRLGAIVDIAIVARSTGHRRLFGPDRAQDWAQIGPSRRNLPRIHARRPSPQDTVGFITTSPCLVSPPHRCSTELRRQPQPRHPRPLHRSQRCAAARSPSPPPSTGRGAAAATAVAGGGGGQGDERRGWFLGFLVGLRSRSSGSDPGGVGK
jgi:hypothetical protein